jgi:hypothetical protein
MADLDPKRDARVQRLRGECGATFGLGGVACRHPGDAARERAVRMKIPFRRRDDLIISDTPVVEAHAMQQHAARSLDRSDAFARRDRDGPNLRGSIGCPARLARIVQQ